MFLKTELRSQKSITIEIKNSLEGLNTRLEMTEERSNESEDRSAENIQSEEEREKKLKRNEQNFINLWDKMKSIDIHEMRDQKKWKGAGKNLNNG